MEAGGSNEEFSSGKGAQSSVKLHDKHGSACVAFPSLSRQQNKSLLPR
jgi:hypothetical protein